MAQHYVAAVSGKLGELNIRLAKQLAAGRGLQSVVEIIDALVARNDELERQLAIMTAGNDSVTQTGQYNAPAPGSTGSVVSPSGAI